MHACRLCVILVTFYGLLCYGRELSSGLLLRHLGVDRHETPSMALGRFFPGGRGCRVMCRMLRVDQKG